MEPADRSEIQEHYAAVSSGSGWLYLLAGLGLFNLIIRALRMDFVLIAIQFTESLTYAATLPRFAGYRIALFVISLVIIGLFALFGYFARRRHRWAFVAGMVLYGLDTMLLLSYFAAGFDIGLTIYTLFHLFGLYKIFQGTVACWALARIDREDRLLEQSLARGRARVKQTMAEYDPFDDYPTPRA